MKRPRRFRRGLLNRSFASISRAQTAQLPRRELFRFRRAFNEGAQHGRERYQTEGKSKALDAQDARIAPNSWVIRFVHRHLGRFPGPALQCSHERV